MPMRSEFARFMPAMAAGRAAPDVAATDHDREFESPAFHGRGDLYREKVNRRSVNGFVARGRGQCFAREL